MKLMQANANSNSKSNGVEEFLGKRIGGFDATNIFILGHSGCEINGATSNRQKPTRQKTIGQKPTRQKH